MATSRLPRVVWLLGLVSLLMDLSSEMIHALLPVFLVGSLGATPAMVGWIEGLGEATAAITKVFSGVLSDRLRLRKPLVVLGYGLAAVTKPLFPLANSAGWVLTARVIDRVGKGIRGAPRDALVADVTPTAMRGAAFGLRQALDTAGALLGPLAALGLMWLLADNIRGVFWVAVVPAVAAVALLVFGVQEPAQHVDAVRPARSLPHWRDLALFGAAYWRLVLVGAMYALARFSEAFLVLRANDVGLTLAWTPLVLVVMNFTYVFSAYPAGILSDRMGRRGLLAIGLMLLIVADLVLAYGGSVGVVLFGAALWGLHMGLSQGLLSALIADTAPENLRGSAFGVFNFVSGIATLVASVLAGALWEWRGPPAAFLVGVALGVAALVSLIWLRATTDDPTQDASAR